MAQSSVNVVCPHCGAINRIPADRPFKEAKCGRCHRPLFEGKPSPSATETFERHLAKNDIPVVVDFWAPWCGPCHAMAPAYERAAAELEPRYRFLKVNIEEEPELAARYEVRGIPMLMLFAQGNPVAQSAGAMNTAGITSWLRAHEQEHQPPGQSQRPRSGPQAAEQ